MLKAKIVTAGNGRRSTKKRERNSAAKCWASAALPPLPAIRSLPPARSEVPIDCAIAAIVPSSAPSFAALCRAPSERLK
jgi:hypothetical protein